MTERLTTRIRSNSLCTPWGLSIIRLNNFVLSNTDTWLTCLSDNTWFIPFPWLKIKIKASTNNISFRHISLHLIIYKLNPYRTDQLCTEHDLFGLRKVTENKSEVTKTRSFRVECVAFVKVLREKNSDYFIENYSSPRLSLKRVLCQIKYGIR